MTNLAPEPNWSDVRQLEANEYATGGAGGNMNEQALALTARTGYLDKYTASPYRTGKVYGLNERVQLESGDIVKSTVANNTANPNTDMTGWVKINDASQIIDASGKTQQEINDARVISIKDYMTQAQLKDCLLEDPVLNHSDAFQRAVDAAIAKKTQGIFIPFDRGEIYNLNQTVNLNVGGFTIKGNRNPSYFRDSSGWRGYIRAPETVTEFFNYNNGAGAGVYLSDQLVVDGIAAIGNDRVDGTKRVQTLVAHDANNNGPHRGILFNRVSAHGFNSVLDIVEGNPTNNISAATVVFENGCVFQNNNATGRANGRTFGLRVSGIQSENGSKFAGRWDGPVTICDNMLEGQSNVIDIDANQTSLIIENNYMEFAAGDFFARLKGTTQNCVFDERPNFVSTINSTDFYLLNGNCKVISNGQYQTRSDRKSLLTLNQATLVYGSKFNGACYTGVNRNANPTDGFFGWTDPKPLNMAPNAVTNKNLGVDILKTPFGVTKTGLSVTGDSAYLSVDKSYAIGDVVLFTALVKINGKFSPTINLYNQAFSSLGSISQLATQETGVDDWYVATWCRATTIAGTGVRAKFSIGINNLYVAAIGMDVIPQSEFKTFNGVIRAPVQIFNPYIRTTTDIEQDRSVTFGTIAAGSTATPTTKNFTLTLDNVRQGDDVRINVVGDLLGTNLSWSVTSDNTITAILSNTQASEKAIGTLPIKIRVIK